MLQGYGIARPPRIEFAGALYHVTAGSNVRSGVCLRNEGHEKYLARISHQAA